ncbi:precorrin-6A reductase [Pelotomaculum propionicicum]|uniref:Cobalt-precorrin-6A reductase n=1 Tax=Pelotomaculum propionicicum TaxID=258475 RepID=A0A4Y7RN15_9FIRM|nr:precorrin-6A reductase [Pelotomaculum propionicicum]NLI12068.1 precorrin-6A reductase [Peptococcaceae bacterium]TEB10388.1 Cobalt-precorrin-6A reductase [Pelotomaculum propionicicum]
MILLLSGTHEGREIVTRLSQKGYRVITLTSSEYGCKQAMDDGSQEAFTGELGRKELLRLLEQKAVKAVVDSTHPFPGRISNLMEELCNQRGILRIRYLRDETNLPDNSLIYPVFSWEEAAKKAAGLGKTIFLTTGSNNLEVFLDNVKGLDLRIVVRILPEHKVVRKCQDLGLAPKDIVAMQGPFSKEMNRIIFKSYNAKVIVTKDSGRAGGTDTKISAALSLNIPVVVIKRDKVGEGNIVRTYNEITEILKTVF